MSYVYGITKALADAIEALTPDETSLTDTAVYADFPDAFVWDSATPLPDSADEIPGDCPDRVFWLEDAEQSVDVAMGQGATHKTPVTITYNLAVAYACGGDVRPIVLGVLRDDEARLRKMLFCMLSGGSYTWPTGVQVSGVVPQPDWRRVQSANGQYQLLTGTVQVTYSRVIN